MDPLSPTCNLALTPFRGVECSDAAGAQVAYEFVAARLAAPNGTTTGRRWDDYLKSPWFNYVDERDGSVHQVGGVRFLVCVCFLGRGVRHYQQLLTDCTSNHTHPTTHTPLSLLPFIRYGTTTPNP